MGQPSVSLLSSAHVQIGSAQFAATLGVIHEDVWLTRVSGRKTELMSIAYPFEIAVNNITGVEEVKAFSDIR